MKFFFSRVLQMRQESKHKLKKGCGCGGGTGFFLEDGCCFWPCLAFDAESSKMKKIPRFCDQEIFSMKYFLIIIPR